MMAGRKVACTSGAIVWVRKAFDSTAGDGEPQWSGTLRGKLGRDALDPAKVQLQVALFPEPSPQAPGDLQVLEHVSFSRDASDRQEPLS